MNGTTAIFTREFAAFFHSPVAYVFSIAFLLITGGGFMMEFFIRGTADMDPFFTLLPWVCMIFVPALSMRLWTEERKQGTLALLSSLPITTGSLVLGKFLASYLFFLTVLAGTLPLAAVVSWFGEPDLGRIASGYAGAAFLGGVFLAAGMWCGCHLSDQIAAFILGVLASFALYVLGTEEVARFVDGWAGGLGTFLRMGAGSAGHYEAFVRGLAPLSDIVYFLSWTTGLLALNTYALSYPLRLVRNSYATVFSVLVAGSAVFLSAWAGEAGLARMDLTSDRTYSLSRESERILSRIPYPLDITYFVSPPEAMPSELRQFEKEVTERLSGYARISDRIRFKVVRLADPDSEDAKELARRGVIPFSARTVSKDSYAVTKIYSALTMTYLDKVQQAVPQVLPDNLGELEYRLMSTLVRMMRDGPPFVSMYASVDMPDERYMSQSAQKTFTRLGFRMPTPMDRFDQLAEAIKQEGYGFERISLAKDPPIPEKTDCLLVLGPDGFTDRETGAIKEFLSTGKPVILALNTHSYEYRPGGSGGINVTAKEVRHGLSDFLAGIGVPLSQKILMDEAQDTVYLTKKVDIQGRSGDQVRVPVKLPIQPSVTGDRINGSDKILSGVTKLSAMWGTAIEPDGERLRELGLSSRVLFTSGPRSWEAEAMDGVLSPDYFNAPETRSPGLPLALLVEGDFSGAFSGKGKADEAAPPGRLLLVGSAEMFKNSFLPNGENRLFLLNAIDTFTYGGELIPLRTRTQAKRHIRDATGAEKLGARVAGIGLVPAFAAISGTGLFLYRRQRRTAYARSFVRMEGVPA